MRQWSGGLLIGFFLLIVLGPLSMAETTGLWVAERMDTRDIGDDAKMLMEMTLVDRKGRERRRELSIIRKNFSGLDKLLLRFTHPADIAGTAFLVWEREDEDNERFLYLPALGRIRRIATRERDENFAGTDFSYEDISGRKLDEYTYEMLDENALLQERECYRIVTRPILEDSRFPEIVSWVDKVSFVVLKAQYYDGKGDIEKTYLVKELEQIDGIWTSQAFSMENHRTDHKTLATLTELGYNTDIPDERFERRELER